MSECIDKHFEEKLHHYELGLLSEEERCELELHLLECEHCYNRLARFARAVDLMKHSRKVRDLAREMSEGETVDAVEVATDIRKPKFRKIIWPTLVPISIAAVLVFLFLILKDWQLEFRPSQEALAQKNRMAIMHFENLSDTADSLKLGEMVSNLLTAALSESRFIQVVSSQRINDLKAYMSRKEERSIDSIGTLELAEEANARWVLSGTYMQDKTDIILTMQLVDVASGDVIATERITGDTSMTVFSLVDQLTARVKNNLLPPEEARLETDRLVADVTTHSARAYRYYLEGVEYNNKVYREEAARSFEKVIEYDSTFAMAYYHLALLRDRSYIDGAMKYIDRAGTRDRYYIRSLEASAERNWTAAIEELKALIKRYPDEKDAYYRLGLFYYSLDSTEQAIEYLNRAVNIDPLNKLAYNHLAYSYNQLGDYNQAIWAINQYIAIAPGEANPYDTRGDIYRLNGRIDEAIASYGQAIAINPKFVHSLSYLGVSYLFKDETDSAFVAFRKLLTVADNAIDRANARIYQAYIPLVEGRLNKAMEVTDDIITADRIDQVSTGPLLSKYLLKAFIYYEMKNYSQAEAEMEKFIPLYRQLHPDDNVNHNDFYAQILIQNGRKSRAEEVLQQLAGDTGRYICGMYNYRYAEGVLNLSEGNAAAAVRNFKQAAESANKFSYFYMLGQAYLAAAQYDSAITIFEKLLEYYEPGRAFMGTWSVKAHYYLGTAYEAVGRYDDAVGEYRTFLHLWRNADPVFEELPAARERLKKLENKS
ncbi:MAG: tetratricopeptide repeat protein [candidate division Zixibacteria bacterium]|nr:tetratricopeptide repeat protein [candidate division Zixibacteria bacterium]